MSKNTYFENFSERHIGIRAEDIKEMLKIVNAESLDDLIEQTIPKSILLDEDLKLDNPLTEYEFIEKLKTIADKNKIYKNYIGLGFNPSILPKVIEQNILNNPGWYTQYTPYQAEISQGRLEALLNFQTLVSDLTGLPLSNASLLDEPTSAAEAMIMCKNICKRKEAKKIFVSDKCFPQTINVLKTRALPLNIEVIVANYKETELDDKYFAVLLQYPDVDGEIINFKDFIDKAKGKDILVIIASDILSLVLLKPPSELGADVAVGSTQRFGIPLFYGGPHAAYFSTRDEYKRFIPGRIIGVSIDSNNKIAYRMALQTREQHIKREKATSNICTSQVLLAIIAGMYAVYHGREGLQRIAKRITLFSHIINEELSKSGFLQINKMFFDTIKISIKDKSHIKSIKELAESKFCNFYYGEDFIRISINERTDINDVIEIINIFNKVNNKAIKTKISIDEYDNIFKKNTDIYRADKYLTHPVFNKYKSEMEILRYIKSLENKDLSLTGSMIPLGSCTMKLNASTEIAGILFPEFSEIHPFAPENQTAGYFELINDLGKDLCEITGFDSISFQPNSGAQGEYTGLMVIRKYHHSRGDFERDVVLIPSSAHGTNPASAVMAGMRVIVVKCDDKGNIDMNDLKRNIEIHKEKLAAIMVTYPSTHGVFEESIVELCEIIHENGGLVYMDGANMNAQVGLTSPAQIGADVCHLNLHKTFCIPHGGGGPGVGPIAVKNFLSEFLPCSPFADNNSKSIGSVSGSTFGSAGILMIPFAYIKMMGVKGLKEATKIAILNANYVKDRLKSHYKILYSGKLDRVGHEFIFDMREFKKTANIEVVDIAKRLMDYGFHAPTVSFPVPGTLMFEPTESESKKELDRFCDAMILIRKEIKNIEEGIHDINDNLLKNSPHTARYISKNEWKHPYTREEAAYPLGDSMIKFWPSVGRINDAYGDRNLMCSCPPLSDYEG